MSTDKKITDWVDPKDKSGEFKRGASAFRDFISKEPGAKFPAEKGRYHLYVAYACPWAHRALIVRKLKGLEEIIPFTSVHWHMQAKGWHFATAEDKIPGENTGPDPLHPSYTHLRDIYLACSPDYSGRFTVPTLYDHIQKTIVSNESSEIIRMMYTAFDHLLPSQYCAPTIDLFPDSLRTEIDAMNAWVYDGVNNGVYKSGFATSADAYTKNVHHLFDCLDRLETHTAACHAKGERFLFGDTVTEADVRLYTTLVRFDPVYVQHFKCNIRDIRSGYPALHRWLRTLYWNVDAFGSTTQFEHIKKHYTKSHPQINPLGLTPVGPLPDILRLDEEVQAVAAAVKASRK